MTELETMKRAKSYIDSLANGVNPLTGELIEDDSVVNNIRISRCLFYVSDVLGRVIENGGEVKAARQADNRLPFSVTPEQTERIYVSEEPVGITVFTKRIAGVLEENVKPLAAVTITNWLTENGYLAEEISGGKRRRVSTAKGVQVGIETVDDVSMNGVPYKKNLYTERAQRFIIQNLQNITAK